MLLITRCALVLNESNRGHCRPKTLMRGRGAQFPDRFKS